MASSTSEPPRNHLSYCTPRCLCTACKTCWLSPKAHAEKGCVAYMCHKHRKSPSPKAKHRKGRNACSTMCRCLCGYCWYLPIQHRSQNCASYQQVKELEDVLDILDEQPPRKYLRLTRRLPHRHHNSQAQTLATIAGPSNNQEPYAQQQVNRSSPFPTPPKTLDTFLMPPIPAENFWSSSGSEETPVKHGEASEVTEIKTELSLEKLEIYTPDTSTDSLTDDDIGNLPPHIIVISRPNEEEQQPLSLIQSNARGSQPILPPPSQTEDRQACAKTTGPKEEPEEYIEVAEPKAETKMVTSCPAPPTIPTPPLDTQGYLESLEWNRISKTPVTMEILLAFPQTRRGLEEAVAGGSSAVADFDNQISLLLRSCRLLGRPACREIISRALSTP
jgi:hypothetical protein